MATAPSTHQPERSWVATRLRGGLLVGLLAFGAVAIWAATQWVKTQQAARVPKEPALTSALQPSEPLIQYQPVKQDPPGALPPEKTGEELQRLRQEIEMLKRQKPGTTTTAAPTKYVHQPTLILAQEIPKTAVPEEPTYPILPGWYLPCVVETAMHSDVGDSEFVAVVNQTVYSTDDRGVPLIPQGSKLVGMGQGSKLVYGHERLRTVSLTLSRRQDPTPIDLGDAPIIDQEGMAGLVSDVNHHFWRNVGALFIAGTLRGGMQGMQTAMMGGGPAAQIGVGMAQSGQVFAQQEMSKAIDTRPTITVKAGQGCNVVVVKPLTLTAAKGESSSATQRARVGDGLGD